MSSFVTSYFCLDSYPKTCSDCPFLKKQNYRDGAYSGVCYSCGLGYMEHGDTREFDISNKRWKDCAIEDDERVNVPFIKKPEKDNQTKIAYSMADVLYLCDRKACKKCSFPQCCHTTDVRHATNFSMIPECCDGEKSDDRAIYFEDDDYPECNLELERINDILGPVAMWIGLAEEAAELSQAAAKLARFYEGHNPVAYDIRNSDTLKEMLVEELTDVAIMVDALGMRVNPGLYLDKVSRWTSRIEAAMPKDEVSNNE